jgi:TonB-dependent receptor
MSRLLLGSALCALIVPAAASAQEQAGVEDPHAEGAITVTGIRATIQNSIETKRNADEIVEALSSDEIGDLPALSIGEAIETLTSAASHREQGGATEISLRGLGPFLSSTVMNGRAATNGSGDRSVNFSQFPSELFNKLEVYKTQSAWMIEGGVAGQIALSTVRPVDYRKRLIQAEAKLNVNPDNLDIDPAQRFQKFGYRGTVSYIDQFEVGGGEIGISLGYSRNSSTNPEQEANVSNTSNFCWNNPATRGTNGTGVYDDQNCDSPYDPSQDFVIAHNGYSFRQNITDDKRDSFFSAVQIKPTPDLDINMDFQYSKRLFREQRNDLNFSEGRRIDGLGDANLIPGYPLVVTDSGALRQFTGETSIETNSEYAQRDEKYLGSGLSVALQASDRLKLSTDFAYSQTKRVEEAVQIRQRIRDRIDLDNTGAVYPGSRESDNSYSDDRVEVAYLIQQNGSQALNFVVQQFDPTNYGLFADNARTRYDLDQDRYNSIFAGRFDAEYELDGFLRSVETGVRFQELKYKDVPGAANGSSRTEITYSNAALAAANSACRTPFPESGFLSSVSGGKPLITNVDAAGNVLGTYNTYATFDALCLAQQLEGADPSGQITFDESGLPSFPSGNFDSIQNNDVNEKTWAGYVQTNFDGELGRLPVRGNLGLRVIHTRVNSLGFRGTLTSFTRTDGTIAVVEDQSSLTTVSGGGKYTEYLPSFNLTANLQPDLLGRFAVYRALSRPDPSSLGYGRSFNALLDDTATSIADAVGSASASGNPFTNPMLSWNFDTALEWYPNRDAVFAVGAYYKRFNGGFTNTSQTETFIVDGQPLDTIATTTDTDGSKSWIYGFELTAAYRLGFLPAPLDGLGFKVGYNYANSNFEFEDEDLGSSTLVAPDGTASRRIGVVPPASLFGLSKHVLSAQLYYQLGGFDFQGVYKYRSKYFQQFVSTPGRVRYVDDTGVFEARISFKLNRNVRFTLEGLNLFNEPRIDYRPTVDDFSALLSYGPRYYAGVRVKF